MRGDPLSRVGWAPALEEVARACVGAEEALFATVPVIGDPTTQRSLDGWVDDAVAVLRSVADLALEIMDRIDVAAPLGAYPIPGQVAGGELADVSAAPIPVRAPGGPA